MRWAVEIQNTLLERRNLADLLERLGFELVGESPNLLLTSADLDRCSTASKAFEIAKKLRDSFTGPAKTDSEFRIGSVVDYSTVPPKRHGFAEGALISLQSVMFAATATVGPPPGLSDEQLREWRAARTEAEYQAKLEEQLSKLEPAYRDPKAVRVLELLAIESQSGETLFKIYELMRGSGRNGTAFGQHFGITEDEYRRFGAAVHHDSVTGDWARHAHGDPPNSDNPMTKTEAEAFVRAIAHRWLEQIRTSRND